MPGLITHYIFAQALVNNLDTHEREMIERHREVFNIGTQGPDMFFYYIPGLVLSSTKNLGKIMHNEQVGTFIKQLIIEMDKLDGEAKETAFAYIAGYLSHYVLDYVTHPFIYYNCGFRQKGKFIASNKASLAHRNLEDNFDKIFFETFSEKVSRKRKLSYHFKAPKENKETISQVISASIKKVYTRNVKAKSLSKAIFSMKGLIQIIYNYSAIGKKLLQHELVDKIEFTPHKMDLLEQIQTKMGKDYLNLAHEVWHSPTDKDVTFTKSYIDLCQEAFAIATTIIDNIYYYLNGLIDLDILMNTIGNYSLDHGNDCDKGIKFSFHIGLKK